MSDPTSVLREQYEETHRWLYKAEAALAEVTAERDALKYDAETARLIEEHHLEVEPNGFPPTEWWVKRPEPGCIHGCADTLGEAVRAAVKGEE